MTKADFKYCCHRFPLLSITDTTCTHNPKPRAITLSSLDPPPAPLQCAPRRIVCQDGAPPEPCVPFPLFVQKTHSFLDHE
jgi:hypothetical protein